jgi:small subunit ribosomal protein S9
MEKIIESGKRKRAVARAVLTKGGSGKVIINKKDINYMHIFDKLKMQEPLRIAQEILGNLDFNVEISVAGGGDKGQIEAARIALSRVILKLSDSEKLREAYTSYDRNMLIADVRRKETYKPGDSKARKKRQKSFR